MSLLDRISPSPATCGLYTIPLSLPPAPGNRAPYHRAMVPLDPEYLGYDRGIAHCPACSGKGQLVLHYPDDDTDYTGDVLARCLAGCTSDAIGTAIARAVVESEAEEAENAVRLALAEMSLDQIDELASTGWDVDGIIASNSFNTMIGGDFEGKTWLAIALAICIAIARPFLGRQVQQRRVMLVLLEPGQEDRIDRVAAGLDVTRSDLAGRLVLCDARKKPEGVRLVDWIVAQARRVRAGVVIIDNQAELVEAGANESAANSDTYMRDLIRPLVDLRDEGITSLLLNHVDRQGRSKNSKSVPAKSDHEVKLKRATSAKGATVKVTARSRRGGFVPEWSYCMTDRPDGAVVPEAVDKNGPAPANTKLEGDALRWEQMKAIPGADDGLTAKAIYDGMKKLECGRDVTNRVRNANMVKGTDKLWRPKPAK